MLQINFTEEQTQNAIDFLQIQQKKYDNVKLFVDDIRRFHHNCRTISSRKYQVQTSKALIDCVEEQIETIQACDECYENLYECFTERSDPQQCSKLHLLLWAKSTVYNVYWPAKLLSDYPEEKKIRVQFFGDYSCFSMELGNNNIFVYSKESPEKKGDPDLRLYTKAIKVSSFHFIQILSQSG